MLWFTDISTKEKISTFFNSAAAKRPLNVLALSFFLCAAFLWAYQRYLAVELEDAAATAAAFAMAWVVWALMAALLLGLATRLATPVFRFLFGALTLLYGLSLLSFCGLVLAGLKLWGNIPNPKLLMGYWDQIPHLLKLFELPPLWVFALPLALLFCGLSFLLGRFFAWRVELHRPSILLSMMLGAAAGWAWQASPYTLVETAPVMRFFQSDKDQVAGMHFMQSSKVKQIESEFEAARAAYQASAQAAPRHVVWITVDALRPDHTTLGGYHRNTTPFLAKLSAQGSLPYKGVVRTSCGESLCGIISLLASVEGDGFGPKAFGMFEVLKLHGFQTHALLTGDHTNFYGLKDVYGKADTYFDGHSKADTSYVNDDDLMLAELDKLELNAAKPQFLYFHLMSTHGLGPRLDAYSPWQPIKNYYKYLKPEYTEEWLQGFRNYYDNGVRRTDAVIETIFAQLAKKGIENPLIIITGDHGEYLGEREVVSHGVSVYETVLRSPLYLGGFTKPLLNRQPLQTDVAVTLLNELNIPAPQSFKGIGLQQTDTRPYSFHKQGLDVAIVDKSGVKCIKVFRTATVECYDLNKDPNEQDDIAAQLPAAFLAEFNKRLLKRGHHTATAASTSAAQ